MSWQEEEKNKRLREKQSLDLMAKNEDLMVKELTMFWSKLVKANSKLYPEIRAQLIGKKEQILQFEKRCLRFSIRSICFPEMPILYCLVYNKIYDENGSYYITYDEKFGLGIEFIFNWEHEDCEYFYKLKDADVDLILKNLCAGDEFYKDIQEKSEEEFRRQMKKENASFVTKILRKFF